MLGTYRILLACGLVFFITISLSLLFLHHGDFQLTLPHEPLLVHMHMYSEYIITVVSEGSKCSACTRNTRVVSSAIKTAFIDGRVLFHRPTVFGLLATEHCVAPTTAYQNHRRSAW